MNALSLGMLVAASVSYRSIYVGRKGVELVGFRSGTSRWRPLWLWWCGYLQYSKHHFERGYGNPCIYLTISPQGRTIAEETQAAIARWRATSPIHPETKG